MSSSPRSYKPRLLPRGAALAALLFAGSAHSASDPDPKPKAVVPLIDRSTYIHNWLAMPSFKARLIPSLDKVTIKPDKGRIQVLMFLASWNVTSLRVAPKLAELDKRYGDRGVDFIYAFSHDQLADIRGFLKEFPLKGKAVLANRALIAAHMEPKIPTLLISDKHGWMTYRTSAFSAQTFTEIDKLLGALSGL